MAAFAVVATLVLTAANVAMGRGTEAGACADDATCFPARHARTLLQHVASASGSVISEEQPEGIKEYSKEYIVSTLVPQAEATTRELQGEVDRAIAGFESCSSALASEESGLTEQESTLITAEQRHNECETKVAGMNRSEEQICGDLAEFAQTIDAPSDAKAVNGSSPEACLTSLGAMNTFYNDVYPQFMEKKKACELAQSGEEVSQEQCDADKKSIQESWCGLKAARVQSCHTLDTCFSAKGQAFDHALEYTRMLENNTKAHVQKHIDSCKERKECTSGMDLAGLSVTYPVKPQKRECEDTIKTDWDYSSVSCSE